MTSDTLRTRLPFWKDLFWLGGVIASASLFFLTIVFAGIMAIWGDTLKAASQAWLGITAIHDEIADMRGRSRVIHEEPGMAYVREPVHVGERLTLILFLSRTEVGAACRLLNFVPLYMDDNGVTLSGHTTPPVRQISSETARIEVDLQPPPRLGPGHAVVQLQLEYQCGSRTVFEMTHPVDFMMLPAPAPEPTEFTP